VIGGQVPNHDGLVWNDEDKVVNVKFQIIPKKNLPRDDETNIFELTGLVANCVIHPLCPSSFPRRVKQDFLSSAMFVAVSNWNEKESSVETSWIGSANRKKEMWPKPLENNW
jgi:hypothetical protein